MSEEMDKPLHVLVAEAMGVEVVYHPDRGRCQCGNWLMSWWEGVNWINPEAAIANPEAWHAAYRQDRTREIPKFHEDWNLIGYLMEQHRISVEYVPKTPYKGKKWMATLRTPKQCFEEYGETPRLAVCHLLIAANRK